MLSSKAIKIGAHIISWLLFFSLVLSFISSSGPGSSIFMQAFTPAYLLFYAVYLFLFYFNTGFLIPKLYLQKKYALYFVSVITLFAGVYFLKPFDNIMLAGRQWHEDFRASPENNFPPPAHSNRPSHAGERHIDIVSIVLFITIWSLSTAIVIIRQWRTTEHRATRAEADKAKAELSFLKAQINPHFLFNTLNNIYSLVITKNENAPAALMKLSSILRYVTDEVIQDYVPLEWEADCAKNYVDLQRMRLTDKVKLNFSIGGDLQNKWIAPLILMTFIENVFKHGISSHEESAIIIRLEAAKHKISFFCQNKLFIKAGDASREGIGIKNAVQRLKHLYAGRYSLNINNENNFYTVQLDLQV